MTKGNATGNEAPSRTTAPWTRRKKSPKYGNNQSANDDMQPCTTPSSSPGPNTATTMPTSTTKSTPEDGNAMGVTQLVTPTTAQEGRTENEG
eukprot:12905605-Prorocentrum_lima.AAC.1